MIIWQQDGALPHYDLYVQAFLNDKFAEWIGGRVTIDWPARSPDITPSDFRMWGLFKETMFSEKLQSLEHLKELITEHFNVLFTPKLCKINLQMSIEKVFYVYKQWRWSL